MKILVTGASGFIGIHVIENLIKLKNVEIIATSIDPVEKVKDFEWYGNVDYISHDLNEKLDNYFKMFGNPDVLIHLSWQGLPNYKELFHFERNLIKNYNFIKNMVVNGLEDLNVIGTCAEYGMQYGCLSENLITNPITSYAIAKDTLRKIIEVLNKRYSFDFKWIRLFYMYGKSQNPNSILPQLDKALNRGDEIFNMSGGEQLRDYLPIERVAEYINKISLQKNVLGIINCCNGKPISIRELVEDHIKKRGMSIKLNLGYYPYSDDEPMAFWGDNTKLKLIIEKK